MHALPKRYGHGIGAEVVRDMPVSLRYVPFLSAAYELGYGDAAMPEVCIDRGWLETPVSGSIVWLKEVTPSYLQQWHEGARYAGIDAKWPDVSGARARVRSAAEIGWTWRGTPATVTRFSCRTRVCPGS